MRGLNSNEIAISGIVLAELDLGVAKSVHRAQNRQALNDFCIMCQVLDWPAQASREYGEIRAYLESNGQLIGAHDLLIAAHAVYLGSVLVTNNVREFERIPGLVIENWLSNQ